MPGYVTALLQEMAGVWEVRQRMWPGRAAKAIELPAAVAQRRFVQNSYLEEVMSLADGSTAQPFTRTSLINYDAVSGHYEYFSMDSRAPQQMSYRSATSGRQRSSGLALRGGRFVASEWGGKRNAAFRYRLDVGEIVDGKQVVRLFLTPEAGSDRHEFRAFEYDYLRRR